MTMAGRRGRVGDPVLQKVIVHIGAPKVASTSIQSFLRHNATRLRDQGIYPLGSSLMPAKPDGTSPMGPDLQFKAILGGADDAGQKTSALIDRYCRAFEAEAKNAQGGIIVWSAENLTRLSADRSILLAAFKEVDRHFDLEVILYVRRPDLWLESYWKQFALKRSKDSPARWAIQRAESGHPDFLAAARAWSEIVGRERIVVRPLDPATLSILRLYGMERCWKISRPGSVQKDSIAACRTRIACFIPPSCASAPAMPICCSEVLTTCGSSIGRRRSVSLPNPAAAF